MRYTIKDIAQMAGVSKATVSRVINESKPVSKEIKERVMKVIEETNFQPSSLARSLSKQETRLIGVIIPDVSNPVFSKIIHGVEKEAHKCNYNILLCNSRYDETQELRYLDILKEKEVDGLIFHGFHTSEKIDEHLSSFEKPIVVVGNESKTGRYPVVLIDNEQAAFEITEYLIGKGHKHIAMIHGPVDDPYAGDQRIRGYHRAIDSYNIDYNDTYMESGHYKFQDGYDGIKRLLERIPDITAVFCANDEMAIGAIKGIVDMGKRVPEDIAVAGFDDIDIAKIFIPSLTTVHQPFEQKGKSAMKAVLSLLKGEDVEMKIFHKHQIIKRESTE